MPLAVALELGVDDVDGPAARLLGHAAEERDDVGAPALEVLLDVARRGLADPRRAVGEVLGPDGDVVPGHGCRDVDLQGRSELSVRVRSFARERTTYAYQLATFDRHDDDVLGNAKKSCKQTSVRVRQGDGVEGRARTLLGPTKHAGRCPSVVPNPAAWSCASGMSPR